VHSSYITAGGAYVGLSNDDAAKYLVEASRSGVVQRLCWTFTAAYNEIFLISYAPYRVKGDVEEKTVFFETETLV
jgi:hypothetical protein